MNGPKTIVRQFHRADAIAVSLTLDTDTSLLQWHDNCLKLIILTRGNAIFRVNNSRYALIAPSLLCLNESERVIVEESLQAIASVIQFHPHYINHQLNYEIIHTPSADNAVDNTVDNTVDNPVTTRQDIHLFKAFIERSEAYHGILQLTDTDSKLLMQPLNALGREISEQDHRHWSCMARSYLIEVLFKTVQLYRNLEPNMPLILKSRDELADAVTLYLNTNYHEKITLETLCKRFNTNRTGLQARFKKSTGKSVMYCLHETRIKIASFLLKDTGLSIYEVAERTGFSDPSHFNKMFNKFMGESPSAFRDRMK